MCILTFQTFGVDNTQSHRALSTSVCTVRIYPMNVHVSNNNLIRARSRLSLKSEKRNNLNERLSSRRYKKQLLLGRGLVRYIKNPEKIQISLFRAIN